MHISRRKKIHVTVCKQSRSDNIGRSGYLMLDLLYLILILLLFPFCARAVPSISEVSGQTSDGSTFTITGTGFGTNNLNIEWLGGSGGNIESGTVGNVFSKENWRTQVLSCQYNNARAHSGIKSIICDSTIGNDGRRGFSYDPGSNVPAGGAFVSWWVFWDQGGASGQWKMFRLNWENDVVDTGPEIRVFNWTSNNQFVIASPTDRTLWPSPSNVYPENGEWVRIDIWIVPSSVGVEDGRAYFWLYRPGSKLQNAVNTGFKTYDAGVTRKLRYYIFQNYQGNGLAGYSKVWNDDIYISHGTPARVELCDTSTWEARSHCEIQMPWAWTNTSVQALINKGSFLNGSEVYVYVVDSSGNASSQGTRIKLGVGVPPPPPDGLRVISE